MILRFKTRNNRPFLNYEYYLLPSDAHYTSRENENWFHPSAHAPNTHLDYHRWHHHHHTPTHMHQHTRERLRKCCPIQTQVNLKKAYLLMMIRAHPQHTHTHVLLSSWILILNMPKQLYYFFKWRKKLLNEMPKKNKPMYLNIPMSLHTYPNFVNLKKWYRQDTSTKSLFLFHTQIRQTVYI